MDHRPFDKNFGLANKTAQITGTGAGIGQAVAGLFHEKGANLVPADLDAGATMGFELARCVAVAGDVTHAQVREQAVAAGLERFGAIDILVNNAGLSRLAPALELAESQWDVVMDLNVRAAFFLAQWVGAEMIKRGRGGKVVNLASQAGVVALDGHVAYCASKAAIISMTQVLALEWAPHNIQINAISPPVVLTEMGCKYWVGERGERGEEMKKKDSGPPLRLPGGNRGLRVVPGERGGLDDQRRKPPRGRRLHGPASSRYDRPRTTIFPTPRQPLIPPFSFYASPRP